jgi:hypothetical protein
MQKENIYFELFCFVWNPYLKTVSPFNKLKEKADWVCQIWSQLKTKDRNLIRTNVHGFDILMSVYNR